MKPRIDQLFVIAQVRTSAPLKEFEYKTWRETPKHGIKSVKAVGANGAPECLAEYFYEIEYISQMSNVPELMEKLRQATIKPKHHETISQYKI